LPNTDANSTVFDFLVIFCSFYVYSLVPGGWHQCLEEFSGATTVSVFQEFFINMLLSNLASLIKNQADEELLISSRSSNKYRYQANRAFVIGRIKRILPKILCGILKLSSVDQLFLDSLRCRSQIIPGRLFRRKKNKAKGRTHFNNQKAAF